MPDVNGKENRVAISFMQWKNGCLAICLPFANNQRGLGGPRGQLP